MIKEPWKSIIKLVIIILTSLTTTVSANASGLTETIVSAMN